VLSFIQGASTHRLLHPLFLSESAGGAVGWAKFCTHSLAILPQTAPEIKSSSINESAGTQKIYTFAPNGSIGFVLLPAEL